MSRSYLSMQEGHFSQRHWRHRVLKQVLNKTRLCLLSPSPLLQKIDFNKTITADKETDTLTIEETGDITKNLTCFGPSITVVQTPPTYYSKTYTGACLTTASCNIQANFGLEYFRYLYTGGSGALSAAMLSMLVALQDFSFICRIVTGTSVIWSLSFPSRCYFS